MATLKSASYQRIEAVPSSVIWILAAGIRIVFLLYGEWQDANLEVPFTDVDYYVYTDAARHVLKGESPYLRHTYRYTPLLALLLVPCHTMHFSFGKILFAVLDLFLGGLIEKLAVIRGVPKPYAQLCACVWLFNPMSFTVSTRGNADVLICAMVVATIYLFLSHHLILGSIMFGLAVHFKVYPIVYAAAILVYLNSSYTSHRSSWFRSRWIARFVFFLVSASVFLGLLGALYVRYGWTFIYETYFYHLIRRDNRHNFSPYFYMLYLNFMSSSSVLVGLLSFLPQMVPVAVAALRFGTDLPFACFVQTVLFVTFNKVSTAQYFIWYWSLVPLLLPYTRLSRQRGIVLVAVWFDGQLLWLYWAYQLEMQAQQVFVFVWLSSLVFFWCNCMVLIDLIQHHHQGPCLDRDGTLIQWASTTSAPKAIKSRSVPCLSSDQSSKSLDGRQRHATVRALHFLLHPGN